MNSVQASSTEPATPLERLHAERAGLASELSVLSASSDRLRGTAHAEAAVVREIAEMGNAEIAAMTGWAATGCVGDAPAPDQKQRRALAEKLMAAQSAAAAARGAGQDIDHQISQRNDQLGIVNRQIEKAALDAMQADVRALTDQHLAAVEVVRRVSARLFGLCSYLSNEGRRRIDRGDTEGGKAYLARAEALTTNKLPSIGVTQGEIIHAANDWSRHAAELRNGGSAR